MSFDAGSPGACGNPWDEVLVHPLDRPLNFVESGPRRIAKTPSMFGGLLLQL
jgi:hypothetical protein